MTDHVRATEQYTSLSASCFTDGGGYQPTIPDPE
jgi:hypothetical protein